MVVKQVNVAKLLAAMRLRQFGTGTLASAAGMENDELQALLHHGSGPEGFVDRLAEILGTEILQGAEGVPDEPEPEPEIEYEEEPSSEPEMTTVDIVLSAEDDDEGPEIEYKPFPEPETFMVSGHTVTEVLGAVSDGAISASEALTQELAAEEPRKTLVSNLEKLQEEG